MNFKNIAGMLLAMLLLSGCDSGYCIIFCHNETGIQNGYVSARDECQDQAQDVVSQQYRGNDSKGRNAALLESFARCMKAEGWGVTSPKKTKTVPGGPNDNSTLAGNPWAPTPYGVQQPQAIRQPYPVQPAQPYQGYQPYPQQGYQPYPQQGYGYAPPPQQNGYAPQQSYGYAPPPQQGYGYTPPPQQYDSTYGGYYGYETDADVSEAISPNRAGIGLAPGFGN